jgi:peroxiredoxin Q/BCP
MSRTTTGALIDVGQPGPGFRLKDQDGKVHTLDQYRGKMVVIYFYPEDDTPLCTTQACQFRDAWKEFRGLGAVVLGISPQGVESHGEFAKKFNLPFAILADEPGRDGRPEVCARYGVWAEKNMYGQIVVGMLRTTYLLDGAGVVVKRWDRVKTPGHGQKVLEEVQRRAQDADGGSKQRAPAVKARKTGTQKVGNAGQSHGNN